MVQLWKDGKLTREGNDLLQIFITFIIVNGLPMPLFYALTKLGWDPTNFVYIATLLFLAIISTLILTELAVAAFHPGAPKKAIGDEPPASAIICAYLPNEAGTILETINHFLTKMEYTGGLQIILAYNTPKPLPVEEELRALANLHPNLLILNVEGSRSKAQNLNAALEFVIGDFVGMYDADHCPDPDSFSRAWRWLSNGYGVVQGHCLSRNPEESWMARMVSIEFETIYAVAHPGRTVRDGFGVFGGSNGFWKTPLLQRIGMNGGMLTEDIDSSMRVLEQGGKIGTDPLLVSRELATTTILHTWNQRLRWSQGWLQVSLKHCWPMMMNKHFGFRARFGAFMLLFVREVYPWVASQILTLLIYWTLIGEHLEFRIPLLLAATGYTMVIGPLTVLCTYYLCHPSLRKPWWFIQYAFFSFFIYTDAKNICVRVSHLKQLMGESGWRITPRSAKDAVTAIEEKEEPDQVGIVPLGDAMLSTVSLEQLQKSGASLEKSSEFMRSRESFDKQLKRSLSDRQFVRSVSQFSSSTLPLPEMAVPKNQVSPEPRQQMTRNEQGGMLQEDMGSGSFRRGPNQRVSSGGMHGNSSSGDGLGPRSTSGNGRFNSNDVDLEQGVMHGRSSSSSFDGYAPTRRTHAEMGDHAVLAMISEDELFPQTELPPKRPGGRRETRLEI